MLLPENDSAYGDMTDEQLVRFAQEGSPEPAVVLISRLSGLVRAKASRYYAAGVDRDDLCQEGMIGLLSAICTYDGGSGVLFRTYASVCVGNSIVSFVKSSLRLKQMPLSDYNKLDESIMDIRQGPEEQVIEQDELGRMKEFLYSRLSETESNVIALYLAGYSYDEIASKLGSTAKSVDNALQRVRRKLRKT